MISHGDAMLYQFRQSKVGTLFIISVLALSVVTHVFAEQTGTDAPNSPMPTTFNRLFLPNVQSGADAPLLETATVESVELFTIGAGPVQINAVVRGSLPDPCLQIDEIQQQYTANQILLNISTRQGAPDLVCAAVLTEFAETVSLNVEGLAAGNYTVVVDAFKPASPWLLTMSPLARFICHSPRVDWSAVGPGVIGEDLASMVMRHRRCSSGCRKPQTLENLD